LRGRVPTARAAEHVQIVFSERGVDDAAPDQGVLSPQTWRVADLGTKHALLRGGLGWGNMPEHVVREDLESGRLVRLALEAWGDDEHLLSLSTVHRPGLPLGPATRFLLTRAVELCLRDVAPAKGTTGKRRP
jgi:DNA-binding transcriptional LysR family regulator